MPVSEDDVDWAYQLLFGRPVEEASVRAFWAGHVVDLRDLVDSLAQSAEAIDRSARLPEAALYDLSPVLQARLLPILRSLRPHRVVGPGKVRIGRDYDGGYVMVDDFEGASVAYSLGISDDASWDRDLANRGIAVFQYDHTIDAAPIEHPLLKWSKLGIEGVESEDERLDTLLNIVARNEHRARTDMILKCDIEGHEWELLSNVSSNLLASFRQIVIEMHFLDRLREPTFLDVFRRATAALTADHRVVHVHANNCGPYYIVGGIPLPAVLELTLLRRDRALLELSDETFPTQIDMPNNPHFADLALGTFRF